MEIFILCIVVVACAIEFYKKTIRGIATKDGIKTKASKWELIIIAIILSALAGFLFYKIEELTNIWIYFLITPSIYFLQYLLDMKVIKNFINTIIKNTTNKL